MPRRFLIASGKVGPIFTAADPEDRARARYIRERAIGGTELERTILVVSDFGLYASKRPVSLEVELAASLAAEELRRG